MGARYVVADRLGPVLLNKILSFENTLRKWLKGDIVKIEDLGALDHKFFSHYDIIKVVWLEV